MTDGMGDHAIVGTAELAIKGILITDSALHLALVISGATLRFLGFVRDVERPAALQAAPVVVALLHGGADRAGGFTLRTRLIRRATHRSAVSADVARTPRPHPAGEAFIGRKSAAAGSSGYSVVGSGEAARGTRWPSKTVRL